MRFRRSWLLHAALGPWLALALASCGKPHADGKTEDASPSHHGHGHDEGPSVFEEGKGLRLPDESLKAMGVSTVEIAERPIAETLSATAQVYRGADERSSENGRYRNGFSSASASIPSAAAARLGPGQEFAFTPAVGGEKARGRLTRVDDALLATHGAVEALVEIPDPKHAFPIGTFVAIQFESSDAKPVTAIPQAALLRASDGLFVYVRNGPHLLRTPVKTGVSDGTWIEIADGLLAGDVVAASGVEALWTVELRAVKGGGHCH